MAMKNHSRKVTAGIQKQWISDFLNGDSRFFGAGRADSIKQLVKDDVLYDRIRVRCPANISACGGMDIKMPHDKLVYEPLDKDHVAIRCIDDSDIMVSYYKSGRGPIYSLHPDGMVEEQLDQNTVRRLVSEGLQEDPMQNPSVRNRIKARKLQQAEKSQQADRGATVDADLGLSSEPFQVDLDSDLHLMEI